MARRASLFLCGALAAGCGGRSSVLLADTEDPGSTTESPDAIALFVEDGAGCGEERPVDTAPEALAAGSGDGIAIVELFFRNECTGLGGQYILAREVDGEERLWLGGHGCQFIEDWSASSWHFGVLRYSITAAYFQIPPNVCVDFPGEDGGAGSGNKTMAIAVFETLDDARAFADNLPEGP